jgi:hypothetical protein
VKAIRAKTAVSITAAIAMGAVAVYMASSWIAQSGTIVVAAVPVVCTSRSTWIG